MSPDESSRRAAHRSAAGKKTLPTPGRGNRREFLAATAALCCSRAALGSEAVRLDTAEPSAGSRRVVIDRVDRFRVAEPLFEGVRIVLRHMGEKYSPAYVQGISGAAFRIGGPCPCAPTCTSQMFTTDLLTLLGYTYTQSILGWKDDVDDAKKNMAALIPKIRESIRARRPVLLWYAFADTGFEVVTGYDEAEGVFLGWHEWQKPGDDLARAKQTRAEEAVKICPAFGAIFIEEKTGPFDARAAEVAALKEAVRHARNTVTADKPGKPFGEGLFAYNRWVEQFKNPDEKRGPGTTYCCQVYRTTHRAAAGFLKEIARKYPDARTALLRASREFAAEADALDQAAPLVDWSTPEVDPDRNAKFQPLLAKARDHYAAGIGRIESALRVLDV